MDVPNDTTRRGVLGATHRSNRFTRLTLLMLVLLLLVAVYAVAKQRIDLPIFTTDSLIPEILFSALVMVIAISVTTQILAEARTHQKTLEALRESETRYRTLFQRVPIGLYRTTPEGEILDANPALIEMLGYPDQDTFLAINATEMFVQPEKRRRMNEILEIVGVVNNFELELKRYDGSIIWVEDTVRAVRNSTGKVVYYDGSLENVTARKQVEETRSLLASIVESSEDAIIGENLDGIIVSWNSGAERIFGYSANEVKGYSVSMLTPPDQAEWIDDALQKIKDREDLVRMDTAGLRKDGKLIDLSLTVSPIKDVNDNAMGASIIARDITDQKSLERYMLRTERLAAMGRISTMLAHEVKNPLQAIRSNLELLLEFQLDDDEKENCLRSCRHEVDRLIGMTQGMLTFVRVERKTMQQFSLFKIWEQALALLSRPLEKASIRVESDFSNDLPAVIGIADQIAQVMVNLVLNAIDVMPDGGILQAIGRVEGNFLAFSLINNGPAIPAGNLEHIFDPFFSTKTEGTGLGLFICHNIIQEHGGNLVVENLNEGGVAFKMTLPTTLVENWS